MNDLDKLNDKEQDTAKVDQETLNEVSGGVWAFAGGIECPKCHNLTFHPVALACYYCHYKDKDSKCTFYDG